MFFTYESSWFGLIIYRMPVNYVLETKLYSTLTIRVKFAYTHKLSDFF